jgi:hypothetical protein
MAALFNKVDYTLSSLMESIASGQLGLPDIQRPFVWRNVKVRNLFDSMYRGYPIGFLLFWETGVQKGTRQIGSDIKQLAPSRVIVDGQQRLTSLYAVIRGIPIIRENFTTEKIEIAFNPIEERFEVADAAIKRDRTFIPNISSVWDPKVGLLKFAKTYLERLSEGSGVVADEMAAQAEAAIERLHALIYYPFTALELSTDVDADAVSEVFVRINSEGKQLNQADFILTLMSVFWDQGRNELENFCRTSRVPGKGASPYNLLFQPGPDQLLRVAVAVGFRRARLSAVYSILRGKNVEAAEGGTLTREQQFDRLKAGQAATLNIQYWHDFLKALSMAGYRSPKIISSQNALVFAYALYLIGRTEIAVDEHHLRAAIARWIFMSSLTGRYTSSPESQMEFDLARLRGVSDADAFLAVIDEACAATLTSDFWSITLPGDLATSAARSPSMFAFYAALNVLDARALYSQHTVRELMDPSTQAIRSSLERHHLFPVAHLKSAGIIDQREYNQIANFSIIEWGDNAAISASPPANYVPQMEARYDSGTIQAMYRHHALPMGWEGMEYFAFLRERRSLMAATIKAAYERLAGHPSREPASLSIEDLVTTGETSTVEFKSTLRTNLHTGEKDSKIELMVLKTIGGFLNSPTGGTLIIGVADDGSPVGLQADGFPDEDKMALHLINLLKDRLGGHQALSVHPRFDDYSDVRALIVECEPAKAPVFVKDGGLERFYVRYGPSTQELPGSQVQAFIKHRFPGSA